MCVDIFLPIFLQYVILYVCTVFGCGGCVDKELQKQVMLEQVEMIARLATEGACQERDREIALGLIAEIAKFNNMKNKAFLSFCDRGHSKDRFGLEK